jgi:hypothetical protein
MSVGQRFILSAILMVFLIAAWSAYAFQSQPAPSLTPTAAPTEVVVLRAQLDVTKNYQDRFVSMVQWSLGTVILVTLALGGFGWYTNKTSYERDREALRHQVRALVSEEIRQVSQELTAAIDERLKSGQEALENALTKRIQSVTFQIGELRNELLELQSDALKRVAEEAFREKRYAWAIYNWCRHMKLSVQRRADHYEVPNALDEIAKILGVTGLQLDSTDLTDTVEVLKSLPARYQAAAEGLTARMKALQK